MTQLVGIVNLTPDSFSGDGIKNAQEALTQIDSMIADGASVIDIGAESTRPGATLLGAEAEWGRLAPVLQALGSRTGKTIFSVDTRHGATAQKAAALGFRWINDVSGNPDEAVLQAVRKHHLSLVLTHSLGVPADPKKILPLDGNPIDAVMRWAKAAIARCIAHGIQREQIIFDPGIGFGKTAEQSMRLIEDYTSPIHLPLREGVGEGLLYGKNPAGGNPPPGLPLRGGGESLSLRSLGVPILIGHSRKSFLSLMTQQPAHNRDQATLLLSRGLIKAGIDYLRVHDVAGHAALVERKAS